MPIDIRGPAGAATRADSWTAGRIPLSPPSTGERPNGAGRDARHRSGDHPGDRGVNSVAVTTKFVAIFIFKTDLDASARPILIAVSRATVHASHMLLTHAVHARAILIALCCPVSLDAGVFGILTLPLSRLIGLLGRTVRLNRSCLGLVGAGDFRVVEQGRSRRRGKRRGAERSLLLTYAWACPPGQSP